MSQNMPLPPNAASGLNLRGAVDLSALKQRATAPAGTPSAGSPYAVDVNEQSFQEFVQLSQKVPVVVALGSGRSQLSVQLTAVLERLMNENEGNIALGRVDVDSSPQIAQAFGVTSIPTTVALINGQPVPMFEGELAEEQIRALLAELLKVAAGNGVTGNLGGAANAAAQPEEPPLPPHHQAALDAIDAGDLDAAVASYEKALAEKPNDTDAKVGLAQVQLMRRVAGINVTQAEQLRQSAADDQDNLDDALAVADLDVTGGHVEDALARLVSYIATHFGPERESARVRLLELFEVVGVSDPRVQAARQALARALF
ncbi:co-chaperone YbbN [Specibacter sp. NPDC057265]|uniref:co-chaperone YbbN n=1 Tax=Specibacter sp. NPDC057265 TaxID=3346075 RepID=UPI00362E1C13